MQFLKLIFPEEPDLYKRSIIQTTNLISLFIGLSLFIVALYNIATYELINAIVVLLIALTTLLNLLITRKGYTLFPKILCIYFPAIIVLTNLIVQGRIPEGQIIAMIPATIVSAFFLSILVNRKEEPFFYYFSIAFLVLFSLTYDWIVTAFVSNPNTESLAFVRKIYLFFKVPHILTLIIIIFTSSYFRELLAAYKTKSDLLMSAIKAKNQKLSLMNIELEEKVKLRTKELEISRKKIANVAFLSSHKLRGPIATILGFTSLIIDLPEEKGLLQYIPKLHEEAKKMDTAIFNMHDNLKEELDTQAN